MAYPGAYALEGEGMHASIWGHRPLPVPQGQEAVAAHR